MFIKNTTSVALGLIATSLLIVGCSENETINGDASASLGSGDWVLSNGNAAGDKFYRATITANADTANLNKKPELYIGCTTWKFEGYEKEPSYAGVYLRDLHLNQPQIEFSVDKANWHGDFRWGKPMTQDSGSALHESFARDFSKLLLDNHTLFMRIKDENNIYRVITFNIQGYDNAVKDIRELCEW